MDDRVTGNSFPFHLWHFRVLRHFRHLCIHGFYSRLLCFGQMYGTLNGSSPGFTRPCCYVESNGEYFNEGTGAATECTASRCGREICWQPNNRNYWCWRYWRRRLFAPRVICICWRGRRGLVSKRSRVILRSCSFNRRWCCERSGIVLRSCALKRRHRKRSGVILRRNLNVYRLGHIERLG